MAADDAATPPLRVGKTRLISMAGLDRRHKANQLALATKDAILSDLGGGLSTLERIMAEHAALASAVVADAYARWLRGDEIPLVEISTAQNCYLEDKAHDGR